jgi:hypothetical protein
VRTKPGVKQVCIVSTTLELPHMFTDFLFASMGRIRFGGAKRVPRQAGLLVLGVAGGTVRLALGVVVRTVGFSMGAGLGIIVGSFVFNGVRWPTVETPPVSSPLSVDECKQLCCIHDWRC